MTRHLSLLVAVAALAARPDAAFGVLLKVDVDSRAGEPVSPSPPLPNTVVGYEAFTIDTAGTGSVTSATRTLGSGYTITMTAVDSDGGTAATFNDRDRVSPSGTPDGTQPATGAPTLNQLYDDFVFVESNAGTTGGLDLTISGGDLLPNRTYLVSVYSFDGININGGSATNPRTANWLDGNNLDALVFTTIFATNVRPTADDTYKFTGAFTTDATGQLFLKGRRVTAGDVAVYLNGFEVVPEPTSLLLAALCLPAAVGAARRRRS